MGGERSRLVQEVLDRQAELYRSLRPAREWLEVDLTMSQVKVLFLLYSEGPASMGQLAASLGVTLPTVTGIIDRLVEHGLVQREEHPHDRRLVVSRLTPRGSATAERLHQAGRTRLASVLDSLSVDELQQMVAGLQVLCRAVQRQARLADGEVADRGPGRARACQSRARASALMSR
jgi:DNA-binding MarR family transcriptional regulator